MYKVSDIKILKALYGIVNKQIDVTESVLNLNIPFIVSNQNMGIDPLPGVFKSLHITYSKDGIEKNVQIWENNSVQIKDGEIVGVNNISEIYLERYQKTLDNIVDDNPLWNSHFQHVYCISKELKENLKNILLIEKHKNIKIEMFPAIFPEHKHVKHSNVGTTGCFLSHLSLVKFAKANNFNNIMILEDDVVLDKHFNLKLNKIVNVLKDVQYDLFYTYYEPCNDGRKMYILCRNDRIQKITSSTLTHCYVVNSCFFDRFISICENIINGDLTIYKNQIDKIFGYYDDISKYSTVEHIAYQYPRVSTITGGLNSNNNNSKKLLDY